MSNRSDFANHALAPPLVSWALAAFLAILNTSHACGQLADVAGAFDAIPDHATALAFDRGDFDLPSGGHLQGIQMRFDAESKRHVVYLSHDSTTVGYLAIVEFPADWTATGRIVHVHTFPGDGRSPPLRHAGGIQLSGDLLVVGLEDNQQKTRSEIQFWNVASAERPVQLEHLTIRRSGAPEDKTAGAVGIVRRKNDVLLAVANWDSRAIDFYTSNGKPLDDPQCRFEFQTRWRADAADRESWQPNQMYGRYQAINLVADADENLFLFGPHTTSDKDFVDLFAIDMDAPPKKLLRKLATRPIRLPAANHFRYAGGVSISKKGLTILSSPRNFSPETQIGASR